MTIAPDRLSLSQAGSAPLRILQVLEPSGGGSGRHFVDLCAGLHRRGHHVEAIYSPVRAEAGFVAELKAIGLPAVHAVDMARSPGPSDIAAHRAIGSIIAQAPAFDILHGHSSKAGALTRLRLTGLKGARRIYTPHAFRTMDPTLGLAGRLVYGGIELALGRLFGEGVIAVSQDELQHARRMGLSHRATHLIVNGVEARSVDGAQLRTALRIPSDALLFGFVGRLAAQKAPERLVTAFASIAARLPRAQLLMIGSGEGKAALEAQIAASGLGARIHLDSVVPGPDAIAAFDVLVMPSRYEAMSYVMLEAEAAAKPIISTRIGGATTVIDEGANGLIVDNSDDPQALAAAMLTIAEPSALAQFRTSAEARRARHSLSTMVLQTEAVYRQALAAR